MLSPCVEVKNEILFQLTWVFPKELSTKVFMNTYDGSRSIRDFFIDSYFYPFLGNVDAKDAWIFFLNFKYKKYTG